MQSLHPLYNLRDSQRGFRDVLEVAVHPVALLELREGHFPVAEDGCQGLVYFVGRTSRDLEERLHLLCFISLPLCGSTIRQVSRNTDEE